MIHVEKLSYTYRKQKEAAVRDISFSVSRGEIFGFLGPSGAGKSTTQNVLIQLLSGYSGSVEVDGKNLENTGKDYFEKVGVSFELPNHYSRLSALENLRFFARMYRGETEDPLALLEMVGLTDAAHQRVESFSKGMKMRLNFARALLNQPEVLFLDEPTSGLDPVNARKVKDIILEKKKQGVTVIVTTHNMHDAEELCDRVAFIVDGRIELTGKPRELKLKYGERKVRVEIEPRGDVYEFSLEKLGENQEFLGLIKREDIKTIHSTETTLEDIFIRTTGRRLV